MTTRATLRARVRDELNDNGAVKLWSDGLLNEWIPDAIREWSERLPRERTGSLTTVANQAAYALPADCLAVVRVEHPSGCFRVRSAFVGGDVAPTASAAHWTTLAPADLLWDAFAGQLVLSPAPDASGETIGLRYRASYTVPTDDVTALDVATLDEEALVLWVVARALQWIGLDEAKRQRFERDRGADPLGLRRSYEQRFERMVRARTVSVRPARLTVRE